MNHVFPRVKLDGDGLVLQGDFAFGIVFLDQLADFTSNGFRSGFGASSASVRPDAIKRHAIEIANHRTRAVMGIALHVSRTDDDANGLHPPFHHTRVYLRRRFSLSTRTRILSHRVIIHDMTNAEETLPTQNHVLAQRD